MVPMRPFLLLVVFFAVIGAAHAEDPCRAAIINAISQRHANLSLNKQFKHDYAIALRDKAGNAEQVALFRDRDVPMLNHELQQMKEIEAATLHDAAALSPGCLPAVKASLLADQAAYPDVVSLLPDQ
jgi:hypothetical protein